MCRLIIVILSLSFFIVVGIQTAYGASSDSVDGNPITAISSCPTTTTLASKATTFPAGDNLIIASVQVTSTDNGNENIASGNLKLLRGSTTLASNEYAVETGGSGTQNTYVLIAKDIGAPASPTYTVNACLDAPVVDGEAKIVAISGITQNAFLDGSSTSFGTSETSLASVGTSLPAGDNVILASVQISNGGTAQDIALNDIKIKNGATVLAQNQFAMSLGNVAPTNIQSILLIARETGAAANPAYDVTIKSATTTASAEAKVLVLQTIGPEFLDGAYAYIDGGSVVVPITGASLTSASTSFASGSEVVVIAAGQFDDTDTAVENLAASTGYKLRQAGTDVAVNEYAMRGFNAAGGFEDGFRHTLIWRVASLATANPAYDLFATASATGLNGEGKIVAIRIPKQPTQTLSDTAGLSDTNVNKAPSKVTSDTAGLSDTNVNKAPSKVTSDTAGLSDTIIKDQSKVLSDTLTMTDTIGIVAQYIRTLNESLAMMDTSIRAFSRKLDDTLTLTDATATPINRVQTLSDTSTLSDIVAISVSRVQTLSDTMTFTDATPNSVSRVQTIADTLTLTDVTITSVNKGQTLSDTFGMAETLATPVNRIQTIADTLTLTDTTPNSVSRIQTVSDTMTFTDATPNSVSRVQTVSDTMTLSDTVVTSGSRVQTVSDTMTLSDTTSTPLNRVQTVSDTMTLSDTTSTTVSRVQTVSDTMTLSDALFAGGNTVLTLSDTMTLSDTVVTTVSRAQTVSDTVSMADSTITGSGLSQIITESLGLSDAVISQIGRVRTVLETLSMVEGPTTGNIITLSDSLALSDAVIIPGFTTITLSDSLALSDAVIIPGFTTITLSETMNLSDDMRLTHVIYFPAGTLVSKNFLGGPGVGGGTITFPEVTSPGTVSVTQSAVGEQPQPPSGLTIVGLGGSTISLDMIIVAQPVVATLPVGGGPLGVGVNTATNKIYVANSVDDTVSVIDGVTDTLIGAPIPVGSNPIGVGVNTATNKIYVANNFANTVSVIDGATNAVVTVPVGANPIGVWVNTATNKIYVANSGDSTVSVIDGATDTLIGAPIPVGSNPIGVGVNTATNKIYVANNGDSTVSVIDGATDTVVATLAVGASPRGVGVNTATNKIYVANFGDSTVSVIDGVTDTLIGAPIPVEANPRGVGVNTATNKIYVANFGGDPVSVIDGATDTVVARIEVEANPTGVGVNTATNKIYVANFGASTVSVIKGTPLEFTAPIQVCLTYDDTGLTFEEESTATLQHFNGVSWDHIITSLDTNNNIVCGQTNSLSPFAVMFGASGTGGRGGGGPEYEIVDINPPVILSQSYQPATPFSGQELSVIARMTDDVAISKAYLLYFVNAKEPEFHQVAMEKRSPETFIGTIPASDVRIVGLTYWIFVEDFGGNNAQSAVQNVGIEQAPPVPAPKPSQKNLPSHVLEAIKPKIVEPVEKLEVISMNSGNAVTTFTDKIIIKNTGNRTADNIRILLSPEIARSFRLSDPSIKSIEPNSNVTVTLEVNGNPNKDMLGALVGYNGKLVIMAEHLSPIILPVNIGGEESSYLSNYIDSIESLAEQRYNKISLLNSILLKQESVQKNYEVTTSRGDSEITSASDELVIRNLSDKELKNVRIYLNNAGNAFLLEQNNIHSLAPNGEVSIKLIPRIDSEKYSPKVIKGELLIVPSNDNPVSIPINIAGEERKDSADEFEVSALSGKDGIFTAEDKIIIKNIGNRTLDSVRLMLPADLARVFTLSNDSFKQIVPNSEVVVDLKFREELGEHKMGLQYSYQGELAVVSEHHRQKVIPINIVWNEISSEHFLIYTRNGEADIAKAKDLITFLESNYQNITSRFGEMNTKTKIYMTNTLEEFRAIADSGYSHYAFSDDVIFICGCSDDVKSLTMKEFVYRITFNKYPNYSNKEKFTFDGKNWLMDGITNYIAANMTSGQEIVKSQIEAFKEKGTSFVWYGTGTPEQYGAAYTFFEYLHQKYGEDVIDKTLHYLGSGMISNHRCDTLEDCAVLRAAYDASGLDIKEKRYTLDVETLVNEWEDYVMEQYGVSIPEQD